MKVLSKEKIYSFLEILIGILVIFQAVKKGGFYISDMDHIFFIVLIITIAYVVLKITDKSLKINIGAVFLMLLFIAYMLPVIFKKYADFYSAVWEALKYLELFCIYLIVSNSNNKKRFEVFLIITGVVIGIFGIDQISSRYLATILKGFNSGYLSTYLERLSSTIQYANTAGLILMISFFISKTRLLNNIDKLQKDYNMPNITKARYLFYASSFLLLCTILTQSRGIIFLTILGSLIITFFERKNTNFVIFVIIDIVILMSAIIASSIIDKFIYSEFIYIYLITILFIILLNILFTILLTKVIMNVKLWYKLENRKKGISIKGAATIFSICAVYLLLAFNISGTVNLKKESKDLTFSKQINITEKENMQNIQISVVDKVENSKYEIELLEILNDNTEKLLARFNEFGAKDGIFSKSFMLDTNAKRLILKCKISEGNIEINKVLYNGKNIKLNYYLLPTSIIERITDETFTSTSTIVRIEYIKDSFKILKTSPIIGRGGEAFRYLYKEVQTGSYISTEAHSSFIQILIESGILGEISIISFCIFVIINGKNNFKKIVFIIFVFHSIFDLNFSYMISIMIFGIISGIMYENNSKGIEKN